MERKLHILVSNDDGIDAAGLYALVQEVKSIGATRTVARGLKVDREPGSPQLLLWGDISIRSRGRIISVAVDDPALFAAVALHAELKRLGVEVGGAPRARHLAGRP